MPKLLTASFDPAHLHTCFFECTSTIARSACLKRYSAAGGVASFLCSYPCGVSK